jgi:hypothetical protein
VLTRAERWIARRGRWWEAVLVIGLCAAVSCSPQDAHADTPAGDTYATGDTHEVGVELVAVEVLPGVIFEGTIGELNQVQAYLEHVRATTEFLRWHSVWRWEQTGLIDCESGGDWSINTGNGYYGGAQMSLRFWRYHGGAELAPRPDLAEPWQQVVVLDRFVESGGRLRQAFPACARRLGLVP